MPLVYNGSNPFGFDGTVAQATSSSATTIQLQQPVVIDSEVNAQADNYVYAVLRNSQGLRELVQVNSFSGDTITVTRGIEGTPIALIAGDSVFVSNDRKTLIEAIETHAGVEGILNEIHEAKYPIPASSNNTLNVAQAGGRAFNDIRTFTGTTPNTDTHTSRQTNGIRIDETGFYNIELQLSIELIASAHGDWGISLIRSNGLTGQDEVIYNSAIFSAHTDAISSGDEDFIQTLNLTLREFNQGDFIYASISFGSSESGQRLLTYNISPSPTESFIMIRRFNAGVGTSTGLTQSAVDARIRNRVQRFAQTGVNLTDLDAKGVGELNDGDRLLVEDQNDMSKDRTTVGDLVAHTNENLDGDKIVEKLQAQQGNDKLDASAIKNLPTGGGGGGLNQNDVDARIRTLRPNAFTSAEELKLAGLSRVEDKAVDSNLETKNAVIQKEVPRPITWEYDNAAGEWQTSEFNANTIDDSHITCSVEYAVVGDSGTATNRGRYYLTFEGVTNAITSAFPGFTIAEMILKLPSDNAFMVPLEVDPDIAGGGTLRATSVNPSNPTDLPNPSSNNPNDVSGTIDFILTDAKGTRITAYENAWKQRSQTLRTDDDINALITALRPIPFTSSERDKLQQLNNGVFDVSTVRVTPIDDEGTLTADRRFGQTPKGTFGGDTGSAQARLLEIALDSSGAAIALGGPRARFVGYQVQIGNTYIHLDSAYNISEDDPNVTEYDLTGNYANLLNTSTPTTVILLSPLTQSNYLPNDGEEDQYATPDSNGDIIWKDLPLALTGPHVLNLVERQDVGITITDPQQDKLGIPTYLPLATFNLTNETGQFIVRSEYRISANTITNLGFSSGSPGDATITVIDTFSASVLKATDPFVTGGTQEGEKKSTDIYSGSTKMGTLDRYITRLRNGQIGYYVSFDSNQAGPASGTATIQNNLSVTFIANDPGESGGNGGTTQSLTPNHYESTLQPSLANTNIALDTVVGVTLGAFLSGSENSSQGLTRSNNRIAVTREGIYSITVGLNIAIHDPNTGSPIAVGQRSYVDIRLFKAASASASATTELIDTKQTTYQRGADNSVTNRDQSPNDVSEQVTWSWKIIR